LNLPRRWIGHLTGLAIWLAAAGALGYWIGSVGWGLVVALAIYVVYTLRNFFLLDRILFGAGPVALFETRGLWAEIVARADRIKARSRNRKKRYHRRRHHPQCRRRDRLVQSGRDASARARSGARHRQPHRQFPEAPRFCQLSRGAG
jgi:hypothetical protein